MAQVGLLDRDIEPKEHVETWLENIGSIEPTDNIYDFIDISKQEYLDNPYARLSRLWDHFRK